MAYRPTTEDEVRDYAGRVLELGTSNSKDAIAGVGQITTLKSLGFNGEGASLKPDGWYLPSDRGLVAIMLETKARNSKPIDSPDLKEQVERYCDVVRTRYDLVIGIVYDGERTRAYVNGRPLDVPDELQSKDYYIDKLMDQPIDKERIYALTMRINNSLHGDFGIKNLYHRMIFTACALVARRYDAVLVRGMDYADFHTGILNALNKAIRSDREQNAKLQLLSDVYSEIKMNVSTDDDDPRAVERLKDLIGDFIDWVTEISGLINSSAWDGEDVMAIFFNEFNRYKKKTESGQVFTPDHITGFMYRLLDVNKDDRVLDACAGSGSFLVKSMSNMIREAGGVKTRKAKKIKQQQLYGIEFDREIFALACANMLIHKDGKTNLAHMDARTDSAGDWMKATGATKVLMNPPYENKFGCMKIVENVLNSVDRGVLCGFILPDKKLEKTSKGQMKRILRNHRLQKVVKLPENLFFGVGITTSIFIFEAGVPQDDKKFYTVNIEEDGLITVKNKGRHDVHKKWPDLENYWVDAIERHDESRFGTGQWHSTDECLSWQAPEKPFEITEEDFARVALEYRMFQRGIDGAAVRESMGTLATRASRITASENSVCLEVHLPQKPLDISTWKEFSIEDLFGSISRATRRTINTYQPGVTPYVTNSAFNNGVSDFLMPKSETDIEKGHCISVNTVDGSAFWQEEDFLANSSGNGLLLLRKRGLTVLRALFLCAAIKKSLDPSFTVMLTLDVVKRAIIKLPVDGVGAPDWEYMESTMETLLIQKAADLDVLEKLLPPAEVVEPF